MKKRLLILLVLFWVGIASAQTTRINCSDLDPVAIVDVTTCTQTTTASGRIAGREYLYIATNTWRERAATIAVNLQTGTSYPIAHADTVVSFCNAAPVAATLPQAGASSLFAHGWKVKLQNRCAGTVTITPTTSTIDGAASLALTQNQGAEIISNGSHYFTVRGGGAGGGAEADPIVGSKNGLIKGDGAGNIAAAVPNTDYPALLHASRHQSGGADEIATATPATNAIPKGGTGGLLNPGWVGAGVYDGSQNYCPDSGSTDAYVCTRTIPATACTTGNWLDLRVNTVNTGAATVDPDGCGVTTITQHDGTALTDGMLAAGRIYRLQLHADGNFRMAGGQTGGGSGTVSGTTGKIPKFTSSTAVGDSSCADDGAGNISCGDVSGNHHIWSGVASPTGVRSHKFPDASGTATYNKSITFMIGSDAGSALADTDDQPTIWRNNIAAMTITEIWCESDAGSPIINLQRDDGSAANILSSNLTCTTSGATGTIAGAEDNLAIGDKIDFVLVTAGGTAKRITVSIKAALD